MRITFKSNEWHKMACTVINNRDLFNIKFERSISDLEIIEQLNEKFTVGTIKVETIDYEECLVIEADSNFVAHMFEKACKAASIIVGFIKNITGTCEFITDDFERSIREESHRIAILEAEEKRISEMNKADEEAAKRTGKTVTSVTEVDSENLN